MLFRSPPKLYEKINVYIHHNRQSQIEIELRGFVNQRNLPDDDEIIKEYLLRLDENYQSLFSSYMYHSQTAPLYAAVTHFLRSDEKLNQNNEENERLLQNIANLKYDIDPIYELKVAYWSTDALAAFLLLLLTRPSSDSEFSKSIFNAARTSARTMRDLGSEKIKNQLIDENERLQELALQKERHESDRKIRQIKQKEQEKRIREERLRKERAEYEFKLLIEKARGSFPWPVSISGVSTDVRTLLTQFKSPYFLDGENITFYKSIPIKSTSDFKNIECDSSAVRNWLMDNRTVKSPLESFTREFPPQKLALIESLRKFFRFLDHKSRFLIDDINLKLMNAEFSVIFRFDQVAFIKDEDSNEYLGCWVISASGMTPMLAKAFSLLGWRLLRDEPLIRGVNLSEKELKKLENIMIFTCFTAERARTQICRAVELIDIALELEIDGSTVSERPWETSIKEYRKKNFNQAYRNTLWSGDRSSHSGIDFCKKCERPIWDPISVLRGYGPCCWRKVRLTEFDTYELSTSYEDDYSKDYGNQLAIPVEIWVESLIENQLA